MHEGDRHNGADEAQQREGRKLEKGNDLVRRQDESREIAEIVAADDRSRNRCDDDRRERLQRVVTDYDFEREENAGDRRIERCRHGGRDTATEQSVCQRAPKLKPFGDERADRCAEMDDRPFPPGGGAGAQGYGAGEGGNDTGAQIDAPLPQCRCLDDFGDAVQPPGRNQKLHQQSDHKAAAYRGGENAPPRQTVGEGIDGFRPETQSDGLREAKHFAKGDGAGAAGGSDQSRENGQDDLFVLDQAAKPPQRLFKRLYAHGRARQVAEWSLQP